MRIEQLNYWLLTILFYVGTCCGQAQINWLKDQQDLHDSGLLESYQDNGDTNAFIFDQALAIIAFTEAGPKVQGSSRGRRGGITLGLMPDMTYDGNEGMPVMFVTEGRPAAVGGIQKGDIIVAIEGKSVGNIYDYMIWITQME